MNDLPTSPMTTADPRVRSTVYSMLSQAFKYPTPEVFARYQNGESLSELWDQLSMLPHLESLVGEEAGYKDKVQRDLEKISVEDFQVAYTGTFDVGAPEPPCPPYEGVYWKAAERSGLLIQIGEFYKHFGLSMNPEEGKRELSDHLCAEMEFLHFLAFKEAQAREEGKEDELLQGYMRAQRDFLAHHPVQWLPQFHARLQEHCPIPFYVWMGKLLMQIAPLELDYLNGNLEKTSPADAVS
jgi:DMSO reductase family type II enzyme chaperone